MGETWQGAQGICTFNLPLKLLDMLYILYHVLIYSVIFSTQAVSVFEGTAVCYYGDGQNYKKPVKLEGIGDQYYVLTTNYLSVD